MMLENVYIFVVIIFCYGNVKRPKNVITQSFDVIKLAFIIKYNAI